MKSLKKLLMNLLTKPVSDHVYMNGKSVKEKLELIARAHTIYFSRVNLINYEATVRGWFEAAGFVVRQSYSNITPFTARITVNLFYPNGDGSVMSHIVELFTRTA